MRTPLMLDDETKVPCPSCERRFALVDGASFEAYLDRLDASTLDCSLCWSTGLVFPEIRVEWLRQNPKEAKDAKRGT